ncbi:MAG: TonB-dependent receptor plug domain-containing protein, partial [Candidatus Marinimicrobia bacterium]|nr:TonB-dependent receptor plug domain-containing protein [Candidatus Neomarinimicrobiota bacterium]
GFFILQGLKPGTYTLRFSHIAYKTIEMDVKLEKQDIYLSRILLETAPVIGQRVVVEADRNVHIDTDLDIGSFQIRPAMLTEIPQLGKDVFRVIKFSPSVTSSDAFSPQYYVRGSDAGENMVQLDGMTIYNPQHFMGSAAVFNPYAIKNIEMLVGGFDAEYGGRNASILHISTREGNKDGVHGEFRPSISGISGAIEFPLKENITAMISGRLRSDLSFRVLMGSPNLLSDFNTAIMYQGQRLQLRFSGFAARDYMDYSIDNLLIFFPLGIFDNFEEGFITNTTNKALGLKSKLLLHPSLLWESHIYTSSSVVDNQTYFSYLVSDTSQAMNFGMNFRTRIENSIEDYTIKSSLSWYLPFRQTLKGGVEINKLEFRNELGRFQGPASPDINNSRIEAFYIQDRINMNFLSIKLGTRISRTAARGKWVIEPRLSSALKFGNVKIKVSHGEYTQHLTTLDSKNDEFVQFLDYYNALQELEPIHSIQSIVSAESQINADYFLSITGYYKDLQRLYRSAYSNDFNENKGIFLEAGHGEAYGIEFILKTDWDRLNGWISYNWSRGFRNYPGVYGGKTHIFDGDQPHNLKSILSYRLTSDITASSTFKFSSGYPRTWENAMFLRYDYDALENQLNAFSSTLTPEKNNVRYPARLDWEIGWKKKLRSGFGFYLAEYLGLEGAYFTTTIYNILFLHRNPQYYMYIPEYGYYALDTNFLPSVSAGYSLVF